MSRNGRTAWNVRDNPMRARRCGSSPVISSPPSRIAPSVGFWKPVSTLTIVVLPAPFGPITPNTSSRRIDNDTPEIAANPPNCTETLRASSVNPRSPFMLVLACRPAERRHPIERPNCIAVRRPHAAGERPGNFPAAGQAGVADDQDHQHEQGDPKLAQAARHSDRHPQHVDADFELAQHLKQRGDHHRADHRAGQASLTANDQHCEDNKGRRDPECRDGDRPEEVRLQHAADTHEHAAQREADQALPAHIDPRGPGGDFVLARRAQRQPEAGLLMIVAASSATTTHPSATHSLT